MNLKMAKYLLINWPAWYINLLLQYKPAMFDLIYIHRPRIYDTNQLKHYEQNTTDSDMM